MTAEHRVLFYADAARFVGAVGAFIRDGLQADERVVLALSAEKLAWLREELDDTAGAVEVADAATLYARNGPMLRAVLQEFRKADTRAHSGVRVVAEQNLAARDPIERRAYLRYEAAANLAYQRFAASVLCPYDSSQLPDTVLEQARQTHTHVLDDRGRRPSDSFTDPREFVRRNSFVEPPPSDAVEFALETLDDMT